MVVMAGTDKEHGRETSLKGILSGANTVECVMHSSSLGILLVVTVL